MYMRGRTLPILFFFFVVVSFNSGAAITSTHQQFQTRNNIEYANVNGVSLRLDAAFPENATAVPAVIIVHGGGWVAGDRRIDVAPLFRPLTDAGIAWFSISYRLVKNVTEFGTAIDDVQAAVQFVRGHGAEFHINPDKIALIGESAGGQLAAMAALRGSPVDAVVALYAPMDLVALLKGSNYVPAPLRDQIIGKPWESFVFTALRQLSPVDNVRRDMPPFLLIHGTADPLVPYSQSTDFCNRMHSEGASCELYSVNGAGHGIRWWDPSTSTGYKQKVVRWLDTQFSKESERTVHERASS
jgi:acetyl esterase/lipase